MLQTEFFLAFSVLVSVSGIIAELDILPGLV
jgi:hypothetical protein